ncbi:MAG: hypothetical protein KKI08_07450 [Armatimonadetes bacterium]|nr:hypothetical protein [Armatimonadota bacterium]
MKKQTANPNKVVPAGGMPKNVWVFQWLPTAACPTAPKNDKPTLFPDDLPAAGKFKYTYAVLQSTSVTPDVSSDAGDDAGTPAVVDLEAALTVYQMDGPPTMACPKVNVYLKSVRGLRAAAPKKAAPKKK